MIGQARIVRALLLSADNDPVTPETVAVVAVVHHIHFMGRGPGRPVEARGPPHGHGGYRPVVVEVVAVIAVVFIVHYIGWATARAGSSKDVCHLMGRAALPI